MDSMYIPVHETLNAVHPKLLDSLALHTGALIRLSCVLVLQLQLGFAESLNIHALILFGIAMYVN
jgi:hypothetical protein